MYSNVYYKFPVTQAACIEQLRVIALQLVYWMKGMILAVLLYRHRSDSSGKTNQMHQNYSGLCGSGRMFSLSYKGEQGFLYLRVRVRIVFRC